MNSGATKARPRGDWRVRLFYGFGAGALGVKDNGFSYFLLMFYSQVVGLDARLVGGALTAALMIDAFIDPIIGYWSDNLRSRWGRRHPFMYASVAPLAACYFLLWNPPAGSATAQFAWLLGMAVGIRICVSCYEIPGNALGPELSHDYDERSSLVSSRLFFAWMIGNLMSVLMFTVLFPMFSRHGVSGQFGRDAYRVYGLIASGLMLVSMLVSAIGTHHRIPHLSAPPPSRRMGLGAIFREIFETVRNRSFLALFVASAFGSVAGGMGAALAFYLYAYFWKFTSQQTGLITIGVFASAVIGAFLAPVVSKAMGKKRGAIILGLGAFIGSPLPVILRVLGVLPAHAPWLFGFVFTANLLDVSLIIAFSALSGSMMADLVEEAEVKTGRRSEGVFASATAFIGKLVNGLGVMGASLVLTLAGVKAGADQAHVSDDAVLRLGAYYAPIILTLWMSMLGVISLYAISRDSHQKNLEKLGRAG